MVLRQFEWHIWIPRTILCCFWNSVYAEKLLLLFPHAEVLAITSQAIEPNIQGY
jgi:hypothetical protein